MARTATQRRTRRTSTAKKRGTRKRTATKDTRQRRTKRGVVLRVLAGTGKGTVRGVFVTLPRSAHRGGVKTWRWVKQQRDRGRFTDPDYVPEAGEMPGKALRAGQKCTACAKKFRNPEDLNTHFMRVHADEKPVERKEQRPLELVPRGRKGKLRVVPGGHNAPGGRHRQDRETRRNERQQKRTAAAEQAAFRERGQRAVANEEFLNSLRAAFTILEEEPLLYKDDQPYLPLGDLIDLATGLENVLGGVAVEAMNALRLRMIKAGFPPALTTRLIAQSEGFAELGTGFTRWIAQILDELAPQIEAARKLQGTPGPSTASLAG